MKSRYFWGLVAGLWAALAVWSLAIRSGSIAHRLPLVFSGDEKRAEVRSGDVEYHRFLLRLKAAARSESDVLLLAEDPARRDAFLTYRAACELYPTRVRFVSYQGLPESGLRLDLGVGNTTASTVANDGIAVAGLYSGGDEGRTGVYRIGSVTGTRLKLERTAEAPESGAAAGASRPLLWLFGVVALVVAGCGANSAVGLSRPFRGDPFTTVSLGLMSGTGIVSLSLLLVSLSGIVWNAAVVVGLTGVLAAAGWWFGRGTAMFGGEPEMPLARSDRLGLVLAGFGCAVALVEALVPISAWSNWDAWAVWDLKARAFMEAGGVSFGFLGDPVYDFSHPEYPPGWPIVQAGLGYWAGGVGPVLVRLLSPLFFLALAGLVPRLLAELGVSRGRWLLTGVFVLTPRVLEQAFNGYVDVAASGAMVACLILLLVAMRNEVHPWTFAWMGGVAGLLKNEGAAWAAVCVAVFAIRFRPVDRTSAKRLAIAVVVLLVLLAPWRLVTWGLGLSLQDMDPVSARFVEDAPARVVLVFRAIVLETVGPGLSFAVLTRDAEAGVFDLLRHLVSSWLLLWHVIVLAVVLGFRHLRSSPAPAVALVLALQFALICGGYVASVRQVPWHLVTSLDRLLLQISPVAWALGCALLVRRFGFGAATGHSGGR